MPKRVVRFADSILTEDPFRIFFVVLCLLVGVPYVLGVLPPPNALESALPAVVIRLWGATLVLGSLTTLCGIVMAHALRSRRYIEGLMIEGGGLLVLASPSIVLSLVLVITSGLDAALGISTYAMFATACLYRFRGCRRTTNKMREAIQLERKLQEGNIEGKHRASE